MHTIPFLLYSKFPYLCILLKHYWFLFLLFISAWDNISHNLSSLCRGSHFSPQWPQSVHSEARQSVGGWGPALPHGGWGAAHPHRSEGCRRKCTSPGKVARWHLWVAVCGEVKAKGGLVGVMLDHALQWTLTTGWCIALVNIKDKEKIKAH